MKKHIITGRLPDDIRNQLIAASKIQKEKPPGLSSFRTRVIDSIVLLAKTRHPELFIDLDPEIEE